MFNISSYLEKFKKLKDPKRDIQEISFIFSSILGFDISDSDIKLQNNIVFFIGDSSLKTEIFIRKEDILDVLKEKMPRLFIKDVR